MEAQRIAEGSRTGSGGELARLLELTCAVAVLQDVERLGAGEHQQHRVLGDRHAVAAAGIDHADAVTTAALQVDCIDAGAVACDDLEPRARGDHCVAQPLPAPRGMAVRLSPFAGQNGVA